MHNKTIYSKDFILVVIGQIISIFGNQIVRYALPLYLLNETGSSALFGAVLAFSFIPMLLLFPIGGVIADRVNKRNIMVILDFSTAILITLFYLLSGHMEIVSLMSITMIVLYGIQGAYQPAVKASIPALVESEYLMQANSIVDVISSLASVIGPMVGGILFSFVGLTPILFVSIICFVASALMELYIHIPHQKSETHGGLIASGLHDMKESMSFMFHTKPILWKMSLVYAAVNLFLSSLIMISVPVLITQHLGFDANIANRLYGYAQGIIAGGSVLGGICAGVLSKRISIKSSPLFIVGCALSMLLIGVALQTMHWAMGIYIILIAGAGFMLIFATLFQIQMMSYIQTLTPNHLVGKVISSVMCICMCTNPLGQFMYGFVFEYIGEFTYIPFYVVTIVMIFVSIVTKRIFCKDECIGHPMVQQEVKVSL